ncbi:putative glycosyltransferase [Escherichia coli]|uniref:Putative glycosyltransferase n=1 Tax=Escherichia coli TaxID=562 RepID=A0A376U8E2_ECOLX|nr:putative glycosyltransferase [Escherichia coli]
MIATHSDAAREVLQKSGGKTVSEEEVLQLVQLSKPEIAQAIFGTTLAEFSPTQPRHLQWTTDAGGVCQLLSESVATCCCR